MKHLHSLLKRSHTHYWKTHTYIHTLLKHLHIHMRNTHAYIHTSVAYTHAYEMLTFIQVKHLYVSIWNTHASTYLYKCFKCMNTFFSYMYVCSYMRMCKRFTCSIHTSNFSSDGESVSIVNVRVFHRYVCMKFQGQGRHLNWKAGTKSAFLNSQSAPIWANRQERVRAWHYLSNQTVNSQWQTIAF